jgi:hypothetical protein
VLIAGLSLAMCVDERSNAATTAPSALTVLVPSQGEKAYTIAGEAFVDLWAKVTGKRLPTAESPTDLAKLPAGDLVIMGSDSVQPYLHDVIRRGVLETMGLAYGTDTYRLLSFKDGERRCLIVAGGSGRSTLYAVYDFFHRQAGAEYFWDGDRIGQRAEIDTTSLDVLEKPRFEYRGLRYFAHRGLHRFQAEHWDLDDWKREIDWLVKKRFNLFMLRTGIDDLFQRAFPGEVPYPPTDGVDPDANPRSYDDRTTFWPLKYRGELRKAVLQYARDRGLVHPEDTGTITHWYSHTPSSFYKSHPDFPVIKDQKSGYKLTTQAIWDIEDQRTWDAYWQLTSTHIREFGGGTPRMFHTIGMAERTFGKGDRDNIIQKLFVYHKTQQKLREHYPDVPLFIASWDLIGWGWKNEDVANLMKEFDPQRTILLDYTADVAHKVTYREWDVLGKFPWVFGIFHGFARNSEIHEDYSILSPRLQEAAADPQCRGLVMWSEISHNDTFMLEYLADNSWQPQTVELPKAITRYCRTRYAPELADAMVPVWTDFQVTAQSQHWTHTKDDTRRVSFAQPQYRTLTGGGLASLTPARLADLQGEYARMRPALEPAPAVLHRLAEMAQRWYDDAQWRRDALDMGRTVAERATFVAAARGATQLEAWREGKADAERIRRLAQTSLDLFDSLAQLLALSDDFSMNASLEQMTQAQELGGVRPALNPHSEQTLKANSENGYCRSHHYEMVNTLYRAEMEALWNAAIKRLDANDRKAPWRQTPELTAAAKEIQNKFYDTPLAQLKPTQPRDAASLAKALLRMESLVKDLLEATRD